MLTEDMLTRDVLARDVSTEYISVREPIPESKNPWL
jgi:hypothetical protein